MPRFTMCTCRLPQDKIGGFWEVTRHELDDKRAELRVKDRDIEELQDKHAAELRVGAVGGSGGWSCGMVLWTGRASGGG